MVDYSKLFVVGCPRSGTTWLREMLRLHPDVINLPTESFAYIKIYKPFIELPQLRLKNRLRRIKNILSNYGFRTLVVGYSFDDIIKSILNDYNSSKLSNQVGLHTIIGEVELSQLIDSVRLQSNLDDKQKACQIINSIFNKYYEQAGGDGRQTLVDKTPNHIFYVDVILRSMPKAKVIEIVRDCRDVRASFAAKAKLKPWADRSTESVSKLWKRSVECGEDLRKNPEFCERIHLVRYEKLKADTKGELQKILEFAELSFEDNLIDQIVRETHISNYKQGEGLHFYKGVVGDWVNRLSAEDIETIEKIAGSTMERAGYR